MAQFTTNNSNLVGKELSIASSFVKQYYTLLNKAPCFIYNFYSQDSTFIHGTIEMANEHYTEPIVGRENIKKKMEDLNLNDCRAKIKQIDCLESLAGGLVIQVIGELSNNGGPMRRFLQTFVLAPSPDESRQDGDSSVQQQNKATRGGQANYETNSSHNQKFYVLNSIFRYQDDGLDSECEEDTVSVHANTSTDSANKKEVTSINKQQQPMAESTPTLNGVSTPANAVIAASSGGPNSNSTSSELQNRRKPQPAEQVRGSDENEKVWPDTKDDGKNTNNRQATSESELKRDAGGQKNIVSNGISSSSDKKIEFSEKVLIENGKTTAVLDNHHSQTGGSTNVMNQQQQTSSPAAAVARTSTEPKTWANMVRNAQPTTTSSQMNVGKPIATTDQHQQQPQQQSLSTSQQQQQQQPQQQSLQNVQNNAATTNSSNNNNNSNNTNNNSSNTNNNVNRRRHMMRKPANKTPGRPMKNNRPPRPQQQPPPSSQPPSSSAPNKSIA